MARSLATAPLREADALSTATARRVEGRGVGAAAAVRMLQFFVVQRVARRAGTTRTLVRGGCCLADRVGLQGVLAVFRLEAGDDDGARALLHTFVDDELAELPRDWAHETALVLAAETAFSLGDACGAAEMARAGLAPSTGQLVVFTSTIATFGRVDRYLGQLAFLQDDLDGAVDRFAAARALDHASGCRLWAGWAVCDEAVARRRRGKRSDAAPGHGPLRDGHRGRPLRRITTAPARGPGTREAGAAPVCRSFAARGQAALARGRRSCDAVCGDTRRFPLDHDPGRTHR